MYRVDSVFYTIQGEGQWSGRPAVFIRTAGCNLWSGHEQDRSSAVCDFCDEGPAVAGEQAAEYDGAELTRLADALWPADPARKMAVLTGGEPALQVDASLTKRLGYAGFYIAIETNGTLALPSGLDWVCVSPKTPRLRVNRGDELKLVYPQRRIDPGMFAHLDFGQFWLSPKDGPDLAANTKAALEYCLSHPRWRLNIQTHKVIGVQ